MGTNYAPLVADLFLFCYERDSMKSLSRENQADIIEAFRSSMFFSLLDIEKRNKRSRGKRKNGNFKRKHKTVLSLFDLNILLNSGRHQMLSKLDSLSISSLRVR